MNKKLCSICTRPASENKKYCGIHNTATTFKPTNSVRPGWIYILDLKHNSETKRLVKIGFSKKPYQRLKTLQAANPFCEFIACTRIRNGAKRFEAYLQRLNESNYFEREVFSLDNLAIDTAVNEMKKYGKLRP